MLVFIDENSSILSNLLVLKCKISSSYGTYSYTILKGSLNVLNKYMRNIIK